MTSLLRQKVTGVAAILVIIVLVILIIVLWIGVGTGFFNTTPPMRHVMTSPTRRDRMEFKQTTVNFLTNDGFSFPPQEIRQQDKTTVSLPKTITDMEYVKPFKISPLGLHEEDLLYGIDQTNGTQTPPLRHHSGHFRHKMAHIWDPHPIYEFTAFDRVFTLVLEHDPDYASPHVKVTHIWSNTSARQHPDSRVHKCFYKGQVKGDESSYVSVSLCHGMTGRIKTSSGTFIIEPAEESKDHTQPMTHKIYRLNGNHHSGKHCGLEDDYHIHHDEEHDPEPENEESLTQFDYESDYTHPGTTETSLEVKKTMFDGEPEEVFDHTRSKRSILQEYVIEVMVVADRKMAEYHGHGLQNYILALMYIVSGIFKDASIGNPITIALVKIQILHDKDFIPPHQRYADFDGISAPDMLREFCRYQYNVNEYHGSGAAHHDTAVLLTRENICRNPTRRKCETLGLAELGTVCEKQTSCSIVQDNGLSAAFTMAHELGHVLNMQHDGENTCRHIGISNSSHVMSTSLKEGSDPWSWSLCSRIVVTEFLESKRAQCLMDRPIHIEELPYQLPGEIIAANRQCELLYGQGSRICSYMPVCSSLWCTKIDSDGCQTHHMPWGDGTRCAPGRWCQKGVCVQENRAALKKVDGRWGPWLQFGECSRTCGGGLKRSIRECNSPRPRNGGSYCLGKSVRYKSCGIKDCPEYSKDFREEQCSRFNNHSPDITGLSRDIEWVAKYGLPASERCKLYCRVAGSTQYYLLQEKVIDGTPCSPETNDICVNGECRPAGCDHILSSTAQYDICGKCGGNNDSCTLISGAYNESAHVQGYRFVMTVPGGSSNLDIRQHGAYQNRDDNYLVLRDGATSGVLLNNDNVLTTFKKVINFYGTTLEYSGCLSAVERINASRPLKRELTVEVLSAGNLTPPDIRYEYTIPKKKYTWTIEKDWSPCDLVCNGHRIKKPMCIMFMTGEVVNDYYCNEQERPERETDDCNTHCDLQWRVTGSTECSSPCGRGTRSIFKECVQVFDRYIHPVNNSSCSHITDVPDYEECEGKCKSVHWKFGPWSSCSKTCGTGIQYREAYCVDDLDRPVQADNCDAKERIIERVCEQPVCPKWLIGNWSDCSTTCGEGFRERQHFCQLEDRYIDDMYCDSNAVPVYTNKELCPVVACPKWRASTFSACSVTCGNGFKKRVIACEDNKGQPMTEDHCDVQLKPADVETCLLPACEPTYDSDENTIPQNDIYLPNRRTDRIKIISPFELPRWVTGNWGQCSNKCGYGTQTRLVACENERGDPDNDCSDKKPTATQPCFGKECAGQVLWNVGDWSKCNQTCDGGFQLRQVICQNTLGANMPDELCLSFQTKPESIRQCNNPLCNNNIIKKRYKWVYSKWGPCNRTCGTGYQHRQVKCQAQIGEFVPDEFCTFKSKPTALKLCYNRQCSSKKYKWIHSTWGPCSKSCGEGLRVRDVRCVMETEDNNKINAYNFTYEPNTWVDDAYCKHLKKKPKRQRMCNLKFCEFTWVAGDWSECSRPCGTGYQVRTLSCHHTNSYNWVDPEPWPKEEDCGLSERPVTMRHCHSRHCNTLFKWTPGPWKECSHKCGRKGRQERQFYCQTRNGSNAAQQYCQNLSKPPPRKRKCNQVLCGYKFCKDVQIETNVRTDGEYTLLVGGKNMSIFCKEMDTVEPKEYLTISETENFSEFYHQRLTNPDSCPNNGSRMDNCTCEPENSRKSGFTVFSRIRINVKTLEIDTFDFTFTRQHRGALIGFGEAGDCYSRHNCPQGTFSIDLRRTYLQISSLQKWVEVGKSSQPVILRNPDDPQRLRGKCGGYCGGCRPNPPGKLKLEVLSASSIT